MILFKNILKENPDKVFNNNGIIIADFMDNDTYVFGYISDKLYILSSPKNHFDLYQMYITKDSKKNIYHNLGRKEFQYPGRLWINKKLISFWVYPTKIKLKKIVNDLENELKIDIWNKFNIEVVVKNDNIINPDNIYWDEEITSDSEYKIEIIPINKYIKSEKQLKFNVPHIISPLLKQKKEVPYGVGSRKRVSGAIKGEPPVITRFRMRKGLGDGLIKLKPLLLESLNSIVYHTTSIDHLHDILKDNKFKMSIAIGTLSDFDMNRKKFYYLSTSRIKFGGFTRSNFHKNGSMVILVLDGKKLNNNFKAISVNYWSGFKSYEIDRMLKNNENEDRIISDKPYIDNFKKYILEIHIYIPINNEFRLRYKNILNFIDTSFEHIYYYNDESAFKVLNKNKAYLKFNDVSIKYDNKEQTSDYLPIKFNLKILLIHEILNCKNYNELSNDAKEYSKELINLISYSYSEYRLRDIMIGIENEIHNYKTDKLYRDDIYNFLYDMKKLKLKTIKDIIIYVAKKVFKLKYPEKVEGIDTI